MTTQCQKAGEGNQTDQKNGGKIVHQHTFPKRFKSKKMINPAAPTFTLMHTSIKTHQNIYLHKHPHTHTNILPACHHMSEQLLLAEVVQRSQLSLFSV